MSESQFFDEMYVRADGDDAAVPWQSAISRDFIAGWLDDYEATRPTRAVVVAAGLGDDAAALVRKGVDVTAFDFSPTAVEWARSRHADLGIEWSVADLFELPESWDGAFDLVVEVFTIQSIPPSSQAEAAKAVRRLLKPGGTLVAVMLVWHGPGQPPGPPWPLDPATAVQLVEDFDEVRRREESADSATTIMLVELTRPPAG